MYLVCVCCSILRDQSNGVPSWCEQLLREMLQDGIIRIEPLSDVDTGEAMISPSACKPTKTKMTAASLADRLCVGVYSAEYFRTYCNEATKKDVNDGIAVIH